MGIVLAFLVITALGVSAQTHWTSYTGNELISQILRDGDDLWIAANAGLLKLNARTEETVFYDEAKLGVKYLRNLALDREGSLWITTQFNGIVKFDGRTVEAYTASSRRSAVPFDGYIFDTTAGANSGLQNDQYGTSIVIDESGDRR
jgi:ligand-binding sensor domain-containing protein